MVNKELERKIHQAFRDMELDFNVEKEKVIFKELDSGSVFVLHNNNYICSYTKNPEYEHRFIWRCKWLHIEDYVGKGNY